MSKGSDRIRLAAVETVRSYYGSPHTCSDVDGIINRSYYGSPHTCPDVDGIINRPGKFGGEPVYVLYYWDTVVVNGYAEESTECDHEEECNCPVVATVELEDEDREAFPDLAGVRAIRLWESEQGFVNHSLIMMEQT